MDTEPVTADGGPKGVSWDDLGCLVIYTLFGWAFIAACVHDWVYYPQRRSWVDVLPLTFCAYVNLSTTLMWVRYVKWRRLPLAERLNCCPFPRIQQLTPEEAALVEEQLARKSNQ
jgi:hypothetical protein